MGNRRTTSPSRTSTVSGVVVVGQPGPHLDLVAGGDEGQGQMARQLLHAADRRRVGAREQGHAGHDGPSVARRGPPFGVRGATSTSCRTGRVVVVKGPILGNTRVQPGLHGRQDGARGRRGQRELQSPTPGDQ